MIGLQSSIWASKKFSFLLYSIILQIDLPSTKILTVPSGNFRSCKISTNVPKEYKSWSLGSSTSGFF